MTTRPSASSRVHPRERGGSSETSQMWSIVKGPSPRARGKLTRVDLAGNYEGSIPASAGEAARQADRRCISRVHPRERGGSLQLKYTKKRDKGPSPRARGKRRPVHRRPDQQGSIPASAGEARQQLRDASLPTVHPRERGGSLRASSTVRCHAGPSPRARGKPGEQCEPVGGAGSIPASAGEAASSA